MRRKRNPARGNVLISDLKRFYNWVRNSVRNGLGASGSPPVEEADLIAYLDGEVDSNRRAEIGRTLASSWQTRNMLEQLRRDLEIYATCSSVESRKPAPGVEEAFADLQSRLDRAPVRAAASSTSVWIRVAACLLVAVGAGSYFLARRSAPTILAAAVALRSRQAEAKAIASIPNPIVHQKLKARRISKVRSEASAEWDIWTANGGPALRESYAIAAPPSPRIPEVIAGVKSVLERAHRNPAQPLSTSAFDVSGSGPATPARTADGENAYTLVSEVRDSVSQNVLTIAITIRERDWHPVAGRIAVGEQNEEIYELNELQYEIVPRDAMEELRTPVTSNGATPAPPPVGVGATAAPDLSDEIEVLYALHQLHACLDTVSVQRTATGLVLAGVVPDEARRQQIVGVLSGVARRRHLQVDIETAESAVSRALERKSAIAADSAELAATVVGTASPLESLLRKRSAFDASEWTRIVPVSLSAADAALSQAAEIRRLVGIADRGRAGATDANREALRTMLREHFAAMATGWRDLLSAAGPVLRSVAPNPAGSSGSPSSAAELFLAVQRVDSEVHRLFAEPGPDSTDLPVEAASLADSLRRIDLFMTSSGSAIQEWTRSGPPGLP